MTQLHISSINSAVHEARKFDDLGLTAEKNKHETTVHFWWQCWPSLALDWHCDHFSPKRDSVLKLGPCLRKLHVTKTKANTLELLFGQKYYLEITLCVDVGCVFLGRWLPLVHEMTHMLTVTSSYCWTVFGAAQWIKTAHNGRKRKKRRRWNIIHCGNTSPLHHNEIN